FFSRPARRPPPRSTLFPYTTLFRSIPMHGGFVGVRQTVTYLLQVLLDVGNFKGPPSRFLVVHNLAQVLTFQQFHRKKVKLAFVLDRKSTRLNSSHVKTSYAVFCLKK